MVEKKVKRVSQRSDIGPVEAIRNRLQLTQGDFAEAVGLSPSGYSTMVRAKSCPRSVALAAECLSRRVGSQLADSHSYLVTVAKNGTATCTTLESVQTMTLNGAMFYMVPVKL